MPPARDTCCIVNVQLDAREVRAVFGHSHIRLVLASMIRAAVGTVVGGGVPHKCLRSDAPAIPAVWRWGAPGATCSNSKRDTENIVHAAIIRAAQDKILRHKRPVEHTHIDDRTTPVVARVGVKTPFTPHQLTDEMLRKQVVVLPNIAAARGLRRVGQRLLASSQRTTVAFDKRPDKARLLIDRCCVAGRWEFDHRPY